jgi:hypothetical protein
MSGGGLEAADVPHFQESLLGGERQDARHIFEQPAAARSRASVAVLGSV